MTENKIIQLKGICKSFGKNEYLLNALSNVTLDIYEGEMVAIMGASGSGKSTLLNIIGCLDTPTSGSYIFGGKDVNKLSSKEKSRMRCADFGFIVQDFALINEYSVLKNITLPCMYDNSLSKQEIYNRAELLMNKLNIKDKMNSYPTVLSGGQKQRTAIARALINQPKVILADEPTGSLDKKSGQDVIELLKSINQNNTTVIIVTHDYEIAKQCCRTILLSDGKAIV